MPSSKGVWARGFVLLLAVILTARFAVLAVRAFLPLSLPEIWRQTDTLGVSLRYWYRWTVEDGSSGKWLPAVLNSGDSTGVMPMEFPLLDILAAPCFSLGIRSGKAAALLFLFCSLFVIILLNASVWKDKLVAGRPTGSAMLLLPLISFGADYAGKFMPDFLSVILVTLGLGLSWDRRRPWLSSFCVALGCLLKPTSVSVLLLGLAQKSPALFFRRNFVWILPAVGLSGLYYLLSLRFLSPTAQTPGLFYLSVRSPFQALSEFVHEMDMLKFLLTHLFVPFSSVLMVGSLAVKSLVEKKNHFNVLWSVVILQILLVAAMAGAQAVTHEYYFMGITVSGALLFWQFLNIDLPRAWAFRGVLILGLVVRLCELSHLDLRSLYERFPTRSEIAEKECEGLVRRNPAVPWRKGQVFRTQWEQLPLLGLCFGERTNSRVSEYGLFWASDTLPADCTPIDRATTVMITSCSKSRGE